MADNTAKVNVIVSDNGTTAKANKNAEQLHDTLAKAASAATKIRVPGALAAAQQSAASPQGVRASNASDTKNSGLARGVAGATGAEARDFAKQAQGLGGLVRVYATFAANIFAATAAFGALSRAADTANLVKGLDQLGAASGRNLGGLAKRLVEVSDGAISMRDSLVATAQASAGGLSGANILRLGEVAKSASQALGVAMPDAISRLTRGITKLEPELLDEIGIMVRVDKASADYARTIGKTAATLTDFEKRQGFANAVLEQGEKKFGAIKLDANPYAKIQANLENLAFTGLNFLNTVLIPITTVLSSSPAALGLAVAGFGSILLRQAIPALGQWKAGLSASAKEADDLVVATASLRKNMAFKKEEVEIEKLVASELRAANLIKDNLTKVKELASKGAIKDKTTNLFSGDITDRIKIQALDTRAKELTEQRIKLEYSLLAQENKGNATRLANKIKEIKLIESTSAALKEQARIQREIDEEDAKPNKGRFDYISDKAQRDRIADAAAARSQRVGIVSDVASRQNILGTAGAYTELNRQIALAKLGKDAENVAFTNGQKAMTTFNAGLTRTVGTMSIAASAAGTLLNSLSGVFVAVTIAVGVFQLLDAWFSKSSKQADKFDAAIKGVEGAIETAGKTMDLIAQKDPLERLSIESTQAKANAINELADSIKSAVSSFDKLQEAQNRWERFWDDVYGLVGKGSGDMLAKNISGSIIETFKLVEAGPAADAAKASIEKILGQKVDFNNFESVNASIKDLDKSVIASKAKELSPILNKIARDAGNSAANLTEFKTSLGQVNIQLQTMSNSLKAKDDFSKLGEALSASAAKMAIALQSPSEALKALLELSKDIGTLSLLPEKEATQLLNAKEELKEYATLLVKTREDELKAIDLISAAQIKYNDLKERKLRTERVTPKEAQEITGKLNEVTTAAEAATVRRKSVEETLNKLRTDLPNYGKLLFQQGLILLEKGLSKAMVEASLVSARSYVDALKSLGGNTAKLEADIKKTEIDLQIKDIDAKYSNTRALSQLTLATDRLNNTQESAKAALEVTGGTDPEQEAAGARLKALGQESEVLKKVTDLLKLSDKDLLAVNRSSTKDNDTILTQALTKLAPLIQGLFGKLGSQAKLGEERRDIPFKQALGEVSEASKPALAALKVEREGLALQVQELANTQSLTGAYNSILEKRKNVLDIAEADNKFSEQTIGITENITKSALVLLKAKAEGKEYSDAQLTLDNNLLLLLNAQSAKKQADAVRQGKFLEANITGEAKLREIESSRLSVIADQQTAIGNAQLDIQQAELNYRQAMGTISAEETARKLASIELAKQQLSYDREVLQITTERDNKLQSINARLDAAKRAPGTAPEVVTQIEAEKTTVSTAGANALATAQAINASKVTGIELTKTQTLELEKQQAVIQNIQGLTESLNIVFGDIGLSLGSAVSALNTLASDETKYLENRNALEKEKMELVNAGAGEDNSKRILEINKKLSDSDKQNTKNQLVNITAVAGASKKMFSQKTFAYKVLEGVEKASAVASAIIRGKELLEHAKSIGKMIQTAIPGIYAKFMEMMGPWGTAAAGVAIAAFIGSGFGGGSSAPPAGFTAEEQQNVQGTGQAYRNGEIVSRGGGALGDSSAKSEAVNNSIEMIESHSFKNLEFSNKMLDALMAIKENTQSLGKAILRLPGLTSAGASSSGGNWLFGKSTSEVLDKGLEVWGSIGEAIAGNVKLATYENVQTTSSGFLGFIGGGTSTSTNRQELDSPDAEKAIGGLFEGVTNALVEAGKTLGITGTRAFINSIQISEGFKLSTMGLKGEELVNAIVSEIGIQMDIAAEKTFPFLTKFQEIGESFSETVIRVSRNSQLVDLAFTSIGLTMTKFVNSQASGGVSTAVANAQKEVDRLKGLIADVVPNLVGDFADSANSEGLGSGGSSGSLIDTNAPARAALQLALATATNALASAQGALVTSTNSGTEANIAANEALIAATGGIDAFLSKIEFFGDNFLTEAQRLAPVEKAVNSTIRNLGKEYTGFSTKLKNLDTAEEFANLVNGLDAAKKPQRELLAALLNLAPAFVEVYGAIEELLSGEELRKALLLQDIEILKLQGRVSKSVALARKEELANTDESLKAGKLLIWQLQDGIAIRRLETELLGAQGLAHEALIANRKAELFALTNEERLVKRQVYAAQDKAKTDNLSIQLLEAQGKSSEALAAKRDIELKALSKGDAAIQSRIYLLQDEAKIVQADGDQNIRIATLLGKAEKALNLTRKKELDSLDELLKPKQEYIYALEDEMAIKTELQAAYVKQRDAIKSTISTLNDSIKSLKDYKIALTLGDLAQGSPKDRYNAAQKELEKLQARAANTELSDKARQEAVSKLPAASDAFLQASRAIYASSAEYTEDYNSVLDNIDATTSSIKNLKTDAEKQLDTLKKSTKYQEVMKNTGTKSLDKLKDMYSEAKKATKLLEKVLNNLGGGGNSGNKPSASTLATGPQMGPYLEGTEPTVSDAAMGPIRAPEDNNNTNKNKNVNSDAKFIEAAVRDLLKEVKKLREQQNDQTGHIIQDNKASLNKVANVSKDNTNRLITGVQWSGRNTFTVV